MAGSWLCRRATWRAARTAASDPSSRAQGGRQQHWRDEPEQGGSRRRCDVSGHFYGRATGGDPRPPVADLGPPVGAGSPYRGRELGAPVEKISYTATCSESKILCMA